VIPLGEPQRSCPKRLSQTAYYLSYSSSKEHGADMSRIRDSSLLSKVFFFAKKSLPVMARVYLLLPKNG